jgi:hypothetical protein
VGGGQHPCLRFPPLPLPLQFFLNLTEHDLEAGAVNVSGTVYASFNTGGNTSMVARSFAMTAPLWQYPVLEVSIALAPNQSAWMSSAGERLTTPGPTVAASSQLQYKACQSIDVLPPANRSSGWQRCDAKRERMAQYCVHMFVCRLCCVIHSDGSQQVSRLVPPPIGLIGLSGLRDHALPCPR